MPLTQIDLDELIAELKFDDKGFVSAIVLDDATGKMLMFAFMNRDALKLTLETGQMHYWSRSRGKLWLKGETSGHTQKVAEVRCDCDADALVFRVEQSGGACHTGHYSCFYRRLGPDGWIEEGEKVFDPDEVYKA